MKDEYGYEMVNQGIPFIPENVSYMMRVLDEKILRDLEIWDENTPTFRLTNSLQKIRELKKELNELNKDLMRTHRPKDAPNSRFVVPE